MMSVKMKLAELLCIVALWSVTSGQIVIDTLPRKLGELDQIESPAFADVHRSSNSDLPYAEQFTLYLSTFKAFALSQTDSVFYLPAPGNFLSNVTNWPFQLLAKTSFWPNNPDILPPSIVPGYEGVIQPSGFLVPSKTEGKLQIYNMNAADPNSTELNIASLDTLDYSYHRVIWKDMDDDGDLDAVTARFHNTVEVQSFVWLENPGQAVDGWTQHEVYLQGPDVHFRNIQLSSSGIPHDCFMVGEFWNQLFTIYCIQVGAVGGWNNPSNIQRRVIDDTVGQTFDLILEDFDNDGKIDALLTAYQESIREGKVYIYTIPDDLFTGQWVRYVIADKFVPNPGSNLMSPGTPIAFYPSDSYANEILPDGRPHRKWVIVSGDDDGHVYILRPPSDDANDFTPYEKVILVATNAQTSGKPIVGDFDGDGYTDLIVPGYSANKIYVFTYAP